MDRSQSTYDVDGLLSTNSFSYAFSVAGCGGGCFVAALNLSFSHAQAIGAADARAIL